jgi:hypothetical protein
MKTVKDFKDAGLVCVTGDKVGGVTGDPCSVPVNMLVKLLVPQGSTHPLDAWAIREFAWRKNSGENPSFKGMVDVVTRDDCDHTGPSAEFLWDAIDSKHSIIKWRPTLMQASPIQTPEEKEAFDEMCKEMHGARPVSYTRKEELHPDFIAALVKLKEPVFTQEMSDNKELPPIGSYFLSEGKKVKTISTTTEEGGVVTFSTEGGDISCCWNNDSWVRPLPAPIELDHGKAYIFNHHRFEDPLVGVYNKADRAFITVENACFAVDCTNIRPLTLAK